MLQPILRRYGRRVADNAIRSQAREGGLLDIKMGFALLKDRRVSWKTKLLALLMGAGIVGLLILLELPVESILAGLTMMLGVFLDVLVDGLEFLTGPVLIAALLLPHLVPKPLVQQIRAEQAGVPLVPPLPAPPLENESRASQTEFSPPMAQAR